MVGKNGQVAGPAMPVGIVLYMQSNLNFRIFPFPVLALQMLESAGNSSHWSSEGCGRNGHYSSWVSINHRFKEDLVT